MWTYTDVLWQQSDHRLIKFQIVKLWWQFLNGPVMYLYLLMNHIARNIERTLIKTCDATQRPFEIDDIAQLQLTNYHSCLDIKGQPMVFKIHILRRKWLAWIMACSSRTHTILTNASANGSWYSDCLASVRSPVQISPCCNFFFHINAIYCIVSDLE